MTALRDHGGQPPVAATERTAGAHARAMCGVYLLTRSSLSCAAMEAAWRLTAICATNSRARFIGLAQAEQWAMRTRSAAATE